MQSVYSAPITHTHTHTHARARARTHTLIYLLDYTRYQKQYIGKSCPVDWGCRIHRLLLCRGVRPPPNECLGYDTKQSDGEGMRSTPSLTSLPGPLWPGAVALDKGPIYGLNKTKSCFFHYTDFLNLNCVFMPNWIVWNRTVLTLELRTSAKLNCSK